MDGEAEKALSLAKICRVCGDHALGYNFNAVTCESCKAFFRRNAFKTEGFKCPFSNKCEITKVTRRFCQKCRMEKCLAVGMKKEWIMSDEEKLSKKQRLHQKKKLGRPNGEPPRKRPKEEEYSEDETTQSQLSVSACSPVSQASSPQTEYPVSPQAPTRLSDSNLELASMLASSSSHHSRCDNEFTNFSSRYCSADGNCAPHSTSYRLLDSLVASKERTTVITSAKSDTLRDDIISSSVREERRISLEEKGVNTDISIKASEENLPSSFLTQTPSSSSHFSVPPTSVDVILNVAIEAEFNEAYRLGLSASSQRELNEAERAKLNELIVANQEMTAPLTDEVFPDGESTHQLITVINLTEIAIRRIIKMAKRISAFRDFCQEDQIALLKDGCTEVMILKGVVQFDPFKNSWKIPTRGNQLIKMDILKQAGHNIYEAFQNFITSFAPEWRSDDNITLIMAAICLFCSDRPHVIHKEPVKLAQASYYRLLRRYLESVIGGCEAKSAYLKLIQKIMELRALSKIIVDVYIDADTAEIAPLLIEIFDLKYR
ncbi:nuclear hormone receptor HR96-like [Artemia franciscana]|uniref:Nuclear hormone receptor HR96 n=1 Tax=Artemia franciscana TaxID=6661 RepID=A0AA88H9K4_ARTSF|nr:hypothetical protein QYM36_016282 [Artemia franciscana]